MASRAGPSSSAAGAISGVWNAPPTARDRVRRMPTPLAAAATASRPAGVPPTTIWPGALRLASHAAPSEAAQAASAWSASAPRRASMPPGCASAARCVASARAAARRTPSSKLTAPLAIERGDLTERVAGEAPPGGRARRATASQATSDRSSTDSCESRVRERSASGSSEQGREGNVERGLGLLDHAPGGVVEPVPTGAGLLAALPGEHDGWGHRASPWLRMGDGQTTRPRKWFPVPTGNFDLSRCRVRELVWIPERICCHRMLMTSLSSTRTGRPPASSAAVPLRRLGRCVRSGRVGHRPVAPDRRGAVVRRSFPG